jgi:glutamate carboxypeptidase
MAAMDTGNMQKYIETMKDFLQSRLDGYLEILREMIAINSYTPNRDGVNRLGDCTARLFDGLGFKSERVSSENPECGDHLVLTCPGSSGAVIGIVSHLDTVFPPEDERRNDFAWRIDGDRIYGPGTTDIKGGTLIAYMMLDALRSLHPAIFSAVTWIILMDATEETESEDFGGLCVRRLGRDALACLVFEGGDCYDGEKCPIVVARKGRAVFRVSVEGRGAHAGVSHRKGASAVTQLAADLIRIAGMTNYPSELTFNAGTITGGTALNRVPHFAEAMVEMRAFSTEVFERGMESIMSLDGRRELVSADGNYPCMTHVAMIRKNPSWPRNGKSMSLLEYWKRAGELLGIEVLPEERGGLSDGNFTWEAVPTIDGLGPAGDNAHCSERSSDGSKDQEYALRPDFVRKALLNALAVRLLLEEKGLIP